MALRFSTSLRENISALCAVHWPWTFPSSSIVLLLPVEHRQIGERPWSKVIQRAVSSSIMWVANLVIEYSDHWRCHFHSRMRIGVRKYHRIGVSMTLKLKDLKLLWQTRWLEHWSMHGGLGRWTALDSKPSGGTTWFCLGSASSRLWLNWSLSAHTDLGLNVFFFYKTPGPILMCTESKSSELTKNMWWN